MPQGSYRHELDYPWGLLSALDLALGEKTDEQDELMNAALMLTKNNMKDDQNHALFCEPTSEFMGKNNFKRAERLFAVVCVFAKQGKQRFCTNKVAVRYFELNTNLQLN